MSSKVFFICQPYSRGPKGVLRPDTPIQANTADAARQRAERLMSGTRFLGVDVVQVEADTETGDYGEPVYLARLGQVPELAA